METYIEFFINKNSITKYKDGYEVALIFDGLQLRTNDKINDELLNECRIYSMNKTGYDIELKIKPFDSQLELPENLDIDYDNDLLALIDKYSLGLNKFLETNLKDINECISANGTHASISKITKLILKDTIVYDENSKLWFYCNIKNVWCKSKEPFIYLGLLKSVFHKLFTLISLNFN